MARANDPDPDPARARLATLCRGGPGEGARVPPGIDRSGAEPRGAEPRGAEPRGAEPSAAERIGWPTAPAGTPAARLRLSGLGATSSGAGAPAGVVAGAWIPSAPTPAAVPPPAAWTGAPWTEDDLDLDADLDADLSGADAWRPDQGDAHDTWAQRTTGRLSERWLPASWRGARWDPGRAGAVALAAVAAIAAVVAAIGVWSGRPVTEAVPPLPQVVGPGPAVGPPPAPGGPIVVSVSGKVVRPGLVRLPEGSRVGEAVTAAGGATRGVDLSGLNLAARLADGEQIAVGVPPPAAAPGGTASGSTAGSTAGGTAGGTASGAAAPAGAPSGARSGGAAAGGTVDLNAATLEQLDGLPGVGPVTAQKILDWRTQNGRFTSVDQLQEVGGIGPARLTTLRARVRV